jgi:hypothetical protein
MRTLMAQWLEILAELAPGRGLITSEVVPTRHARGPGGDDGPGALAEPSR